MAKTKIKKTHIWAVQAKCPYCRASNFIPVCNTSQPMGWQTGCRYCKRIFEIGKPKAR